MRYLLCTVIWWNCAVLLAQAPVETLVQPPAVVPVPPTTTVVVPASIPAGQRRTGTVKTVHDGDTITLVSGGTLFQVRLNGIDAPELAQRYGPASRRALLAMVQGQRVTVISQGVDSYGRTIGNLYSGRALRGRAATINARMVQDGWAWQYRQYSHSPSLAAYEKLARSRRLGLWQDDQPEAPWVFRHAHPHPRKP